MAVSRACSALARASLQLTLHIGVQLLERARRMVIALPWLSQPRQGHAHTVYSETTASKCNERWREHDIMQLITSFRQANVVNPPAATSRLPNSIAPKVVNYLSFSSTSAVSLSRYLCILFSEDADHIDRALDCGERRTSCSCVRV